MESLWVSLILIAFLVPFPAEYLTDILLLLVLSRVLLCSLNVVDGLALFSAFSYISSGIMCFTNCVIFDFFIESNKSLVPNFDSSIINYSLIWISFQFWLMKCFVIFWILLIMIMQSSNSTIRIFLRLRLPSSKMAHWLLYYCDLSVLHFLFGLFSD